MYHFAQDDLTKSTDGAASITDIIFSQFWRLEVQDQGVSRVDFFRGLSPWLVDGRRLPVSSRGLPSLCVCVLISFSYKAPVLLGEGPPV